MDIDKLASFDSAEFVRNDEEAILFLQDAMESNDPAIIKAAMGTILRARGMVKLAKASGVSRPTLYAAFSESGNPTLSTLLPVMKELGLQLTVKPAQA